MKKWQKILLICTGSLLAFALLMFIIIKAFVLPKVTEKVIEKAVTGVISDEYAAKEILGSLTTEDKQFVEDIITDYATDAEAISTIKEYMDNNDYTAVKDYVINNLSPEQYNQALDIAGKYLEFLPPEAQEMFELYVK